jgi:hypothetical protein
VIQSIARRTAEADAVSTRAASLLLDPASCSVTCMVEAGAASTWAAPRELETTQSIARRTAEASAAKRRAVPSPP